MAQKVPDINWGAYLDAVIEKTEIDSVVQEMEGMTGRDLYEMRSQTGVAGYLVDRPIQYAMHGSVTNYRIDAAKVMTDCLVDGQVFVKVGDYEHIQVEPYVIKSDFDAYTDELLMVLISYKTEQGDYFTERYERNALYQPPSLPVPEGSDGEPVLPPMQFIPCLHTVYRTQDLFNEEDLVVSYQIPLPFFPYVAFRWLNGVSFLQRPHDAVIRLEAITRIISTENTERRGMAIYLEGVQNTDKIKKAPRKYGRGVFTLPVGASFHSPGSDPNAITLIVKEVDDLWNNLEKTTGVVSTEKIASLSGISRQIAERPLVILCEDIRAVYEKGMAIVEQICLMFAGAPKWEYSYKGISLTDYSTDPAGIIKEARDEGIITPDEYKLGFRALLAKNGYLPVTDDIAGMMTSPVVGQQ